MRQALALIPWLLTLAPVASAAEYSETIYDVSGILEHVGDDLEPNELAEILINFAGEPEDWGAPALVVAKDGKLVAGGGEAPPERPMPPTWMPYITVEDVETSASAVEGSGGSTMLPAMEVMDAGKMAIFSDPTGAPFAVWQDGNHTGAELKDAPGSLTWVELGTGDIATATKFYKDVFGWGAQTVPMGDSGEYTLFTLGEDQVAGGYDKTGVLPDEVPPHWLVYFAIDDIDATVEKATALGARAGDIIDVEMAGRMSVIHDPQGEVFGAIQGSSQ